MSSLEEMVAATKARVAEYKEAIAPEALEQRLASMEAPRGFERALTGPGVALIAEIKRSSPRTGPLDPDLNAGALAARYASGGAAALSVLTEPDFFGGSMEDLKSVRGAGLPVLRKDFIVDDFQVLESRAWGADAVLLIVRALGDQTARLVGATRALGMDPLVEVYDEADVELALGAGATLVGVNHRDLHTFEVDPGRTTKLAPLVPKGVTLVTLSGVSRRAEVEAAGAAGAAAVLVGESLVTAADPAAKVAELIGRA
jgi:indole-3-glycerol phosphate synthase